MSAAVRCVCVRCVCACACVHTVCACVRACMCETETERRWETCWGHGEDERTGKIIKTLRD